ncbi:ABC transporter substrate-binding protein [Streptomyces sp. NPDC047002]|uniref:ABC transporter substrate-binding protein n=1 Tax=Streptomyces sp. NPDC047002 TaxID=3155475 RepID=UPI0034530A2F
MLKNYRLGVVSAASLVALGSALAACGSPDAATVKAAAGAYAKFGGMTGRPRQQALADEAKKEGRLTLYSTNSSIDRIVPAFEKEYGIKVTTFRGTTDDVRTRVLQEAAAHRTQSDVVETKDSEMAILDQKGLTAPYRSDIAEKVPAEARAGSMVGDYYIETLPLFNGGKVQQSGLPTGIAGFAGPEWKGKVAVEQSDFNWYVDLYDYETGTKGMSPSDFAATMKKVAANFRVSNGHTSTTQLLKAGDFPVMVDDFLQFAGGGGSGAVVDTGFAPVTRQIIGSSPMKSAAHPAAALLWCDWYLTQGQKYLARAGYTPTDPAAVPGYRSRLPKGTVYVYDDWKTLASSKGNAWATAWDNLLKGQDPVIAR